MADESVEDIMGTIASKLYCPENSRAYLERIVNGLRGIGVREDVVEEHLGCVASILGCLIAEEQGRVLEYLDKFYGLGLQEGRQLRVHLTAPWSEESLAIRLRRRINGRKTAGGGRVSFNDIKRILNQEYLKKGTRRVTYEPAHQDIPDDLKKRDVISRRYEN